MMVTSETKRLFSLNMCFVHTLATLTENEWTLCIWPSIWPRYKVPSPRSGLILLCSRAGQFREEEEKDFTAYETGTEKKEDGGKV
jgi:hypothetical protein